MKILWLSHLVPWPPKGGVLQRSFNLLRGVAKHNDVRLLAFNQLPLLATKKEVNEAVHELSKFCEVSGVFDIKSDNRKYSRQLTAAMALSKGKSFTASWLMSSDFADGLRDCIESWRPDLVHFDTISLAPYRYLCGKRPAIMNHHNVESDLLLRRGYLDKNKLRGTYFKLEGRLLRKFEQEVQNKFDFHLTCSELDRQKLIEKANVAENKVIVIPNGVDLSYFPPEYEARENGHVLWVGGMGWAPNLRAVRTLVYEVWPSVRTTNLNARLTIVGRQPPDWLLEKSKEWPEIHVKGFVDDIRPFFKSATVFACPIDDGGGTKLKMLDAMASGIPVVAYPQACEGIECKDNLHLRIAQTPTEMADCINQILSGDPKTSLLCRNARGLVESHYDFAAISKKLSWLYKAAKQDQGMSEK